MKCAGLSRFAIEVISAASCGGLIVCCSNEGPSDETFLLAFFGWRACGAWCDADEAKVDRRTARSGLRPASVTSFPIRDRTRARVPLEAVPREPPNVRLSIWRSARGPAAQPQGSKNCSVRRLWPRYTGCPAFAPPERSPGLSPLMKLQRRRGRCPRDLGGRSGAGATRIFRPEPTVEF